MTHGHAVRRQTHGYLPANWYQIILLGDSGTYVGRLLRGSGTAGSRTLDLTSRRPTAATRQIPLYQFPRNLRVANVTGKSATRYGLVDDVTEKLRGSWFSGIWLCAG